MDPRKIYPSPLIFDHVLLFQILGDPLFWEQCPEFESYRELGEAEYTQALATHCSMPLKTGSLLPAWQRMLIRGVETQSPTLRSFVRYLQRRRDRTNEKIVTADPDDCGPFKKVLHPGGTL
jgi:hypothetical protein